MKAAWGGKSSCRIFLTPGSLCEVFDVVDEY